MQRTDPIPTDWMQRVEACIRDCRFLFLPEDKEPELRRSVMRRLLRGKNVQGGAEILWNLAGNLPQESLREVRGHFHAHILNALFVLALALRPRPPKLSAKPFRDAAEALERVRDHGRFFRVGQLREELERSIRYYRGVAKLTWTTKPKDMGPRIALCSLRHDFKLVFRGPMEAIDDAVGFFLQDAFGGEWTSRSVKSRASEWSRPQRKKLSKTAQVRNLPSQNP